MHYNTFTMHLASNIKKVETEGYSLFSHYWWSLDYSFFTLHPSPNLRHVHSEALKVPRSKSNGHLHFLHLAWSMLGTSSLLQFLVVNVFHLLKRNLLNYLFKITCASVSLFWCSWSNSSLPISFHPRTSLWPTANVLNCSKSVNITFCCAIEFVTRHPARMAWYLPSHMIQLPSLSQAVTQRKHSMYSAV